MKGCAVCLYFWMVLPGLTANATCRLFLQDVLRESEAASVPGDPGETLVERVAAYTREASLRYRLGYADYLEAIDGIAKRDPHFARLVRMFDQGHYTFAIDQANGVRRQILEGGFLNQHQTGTSAGAVRGDGGRDQVEAMYLRMPIREYRKLPAGWKPKSMYLIPREESGIHWEPTHYSNDPEESRRTGDTWVLRRPAIEKNTLFLIGDSFDRALIEGDLSDNIKAFDIRPGKKLDSRSPIGHLLPLAWVKSSVPHYYEQVKTRNLLRFVDPADFKAYYEAQKAAGTPLPLWREVREETSSPDFSEAFFREFPELRKFEKLLLRPFGNYSEGLYFGKLDASRVEAMIYHDRPPSLEEWVAFQRLGIRVIDGRAPPERK